MSTMEAAAFTLRIEIEAASPSPPLLSETSEFLNALSSLYNVARIGTDPSYTGYRFPRRPRSDDTSVLLPVHHGVVERLHCASPLELATAWVAVSGGIAGSVWIVVQAFERLYNLRLNREKLELEVQKLRNDFSGPNHSTIDSKIANNSLEQRDALPVLAGIEQRLAVSSFRVVRAEIEVVGLEGPDHAWTPHRQ